jgi:PAS domain S-box-containing protein
MPQAPTFEGPLPAILQLISDGVTVQDAAGRLIYANEAAAHAGGYHSAEALLAVPADEILSRFDIRDEQDRPFNAEDLPGRVAIRTGERVARTLHVREMPGGDERTWEVQAVPWRDDHGALQYVINISHDVTKERRTEEQLRLRARRQFRIAELGRKALLGMDIQALMEEISAIVALKLTVPCAAILEHRPERGDLVVRAGVGWSDGVVGASIPDGPNASLAGCALHAGAPVVSEDVRRDPRFNCPNILCDQGIVSAVNVPIRNIGHPFGTLGAHATHQRPFTEDDIYFLESVANILAAAIERREAEDVVSESEKRLTMALDAGRMGTWDWNIRTNVVHWSDGIEAIHGVPPGSFGGNFTAFESDMHPDDRERVMASVRRAVEEGVEHDVEYRIVPPDGSIRWIEGKGRVVYEDGRPVRLTGTCRDITERKQSEEERARLYEATRTAERRSAFLAKASEVLATSLDYETTLANVARLVVPDLADWCSVQVLEQDDTLHQVAITHADPAKVVWARELSRRYPSDPAAPRGVWNVLRTGQAEFVPELSEELLRTVARDEEHWRLIQSVGMRSVMLVPMVAHDRTVGCISLIHAESGRVYTEADLAQAQDLARRCAVAIDNARLYREIQWADKAKDEFLAMLSHELRNPLGAVANGLMLLEVNGSPAPAAVRTREMLARQIQNMTRLLDDLLDVSRSTRGKVQLRCAPVALADIVESAVEAMRPLVEAREHRLAVSLPDDVVAISADRTRLEQVLCNLLGNAVKYTDRGGEIRLTVERENDSAVIRVSDTGIGISPDLLPHVFDLFTQSERSLDRAQGGLGIGLTLVKSLVELHGGSVAAASAGPGRGSVFTVRLPLSAEEPAPESSPAAEATRDGRIRVLVVEDNLDAAESMSAILEMWGCTVRAAQDGPAALLEARDFRPDVVLLDIGLPGMNGYEVARRLRRAPETAGARLIAVSGYGREEDQKAAREAGFEHSLSKPVDIPALKSLLIAADPAGD